MHDLGALCSRHYHPELAALEHVTYDHYVHDCCRLAAEGPPSKWRYSADSYPDGLDERHSAPTSCCALEMWELACGGGVHATWAFAAPGYCSEHWQLGRATMTVLGFRPVDGGVTTEGHRYTKWAQCGGVRSAQEHRRERIAELHEHVISPLFDPSGDSRADRIARLLLSAPVSDELPTLPGLCMQCD